MPQPRKHPRYEIALPVHAKVAQEGNSHTFRATTCNISYEGAAIELHEEQDALEPIHFLLSAKSFTKVKATLTRCLVLNSNPLL